MKEGKLKLLQREYDAYLKLKKLNDEYDSETDREKRYKIELKMKELEDIFKYDYYDSEEKEFFFYQAYTHDNDIDDSVEKIYYLYAAYRNATKEEIRKFSGIIDTVTLEKLMPTTKDDENAIICEYWNLESTNDNVLIPIKECNHFESSHNIIYNTLLSKAINGEYPFNSDALEDEYWKLSGKYYEYMVKGNTQEQIIKKLCRKV